MEKKFRVGVLGGTGMVGQRFVQLLAAHPWFETAAIAASPQSAGRTYAEAVEGRWLLDGAVPDSARDLVLRDVSDVKGMADRVDFLFSAVNMPADEVRRLEEDYARAETPVVSNNSAHRWTPDVPMIIPEINPTHAEVIEAQRRRLGTSRGFIAVKPNCSIQSYVPALAAWRDLEPLEVVAATYQAISGAGKNFDTWPEMRGNVIPFIGGEEEKSEREPLKVLGRLRDGEIVPADGPRITCQCLRVPVLYGHTAAVLVRFGREPASVDELIALLRDFRGVPQELGLPSAPKQFIHYLEAEDRPQPALDAQCEEGMAISIGRLRRDPLFGWKFVGLSHNTLRGAAGGAVLCAELLASRGYLTKK